MKCLFLKGNYMISCTAVKEGYIPTMSELEEWCRQSTHKTCPLYRKAESEGKIIISTEKENPPQNSCKTS